MVNRRQIIVGFGATALAAPLVSSAQPPPTRTVRVGFLGPGSRSNTASRVDALRAGLRDLGYIEGTNVVIDYRWADGNNDRLPGMASELVAAKVDVIVTHGPPGIRAAKQATVTVPIVIGAVGDVVSAGFVTNLSRPEANVTGMSFFSPELGAKRIELLKTAMPRVTQAAAMFNPNNPVNAAVVRAIETTARPMKIAIQSTLFRKSCCSAPTG